MLNIQVIENEEGAEIEFEFPKLIETQRFDIYYFALAIEPKKGIAEVKRAVAELLESWNRQLVELKEKEIVYLPIDFSDQYTGCLKIEKKEALRIQYGYSRIKGWSINPINPLDFYSSVTDFETKAEKPILVKQFDFIRCLRELRAELQEK